MKLGVETLRILAGAQLRSARGGADISDVIGGCPSDDCTSDSGFYCPTTRSAIHRCATKPTTPPLP